MTYSRDSVDIEKGQQLPKRRKLNPQGNIQDYNFRHIIVPREYVGFTEGDKSLFYKFIKVVVFSTFINNFGGVQEVVIDGNVSEAVIEEVDRHTRKRHYHPRIRTEVDGDKFYPLVNLADQIAYTLHCYYGSSKQVETETTFDDIKKRDVKDLLRLHITPRLEDYIDTLERLAR